jgi:sugar transferase (PEP-CTERM/EpsH1 system associated)
MKSNILMLTSRLPYPPHQGDKLRIFNQIKQLSANGHDITLISFFASKDELLHVPKLREYCSEVKIIYHPSWKSVLNCLFNIFSDTPFQVAYYSSTKFRHQTNDVLESKRFDIIHVHLIRLAQYVENYSGGIPRILDLTDAGSLYLERFLKANKQILYKFLLKVELTRLKKYEKILELFEKCLVCSSVDKEFLLRHATKAKIDVLYNGINLRYFTHNNDIKSAPFSIIFTGNMSYFPNADGIFYFVKEIFPLIEQELPDVKLFIVGKNPPIKIRRLAQHNISITGFVPDIKDYYLRSRVAIAPIRFGAGTLNKILEPVALGVPVVATSIGVEGLLLKDGTDLLVADSANGFANAVINILKDDELHRRLSKNAMNIVRSVYDSRMIATQLESYYKEVMPTCKLYDNLLS